MRDGTLRASMKATKKKTKTNKQTKNPTQWIRLKSETKA